MQYVYALVILCLVIAPVAPGRVAADDVPAPNRPATGPAEPDNSSQAFFDVLLGGNFFEKPADFVLAKVVELKKDPPSGFELRYVLDVVSDYRGELKEHQRVTVDGNRPHNGSNFGVMPELPLDQVVLMNVVATRKAGEYEVGVPIHAPFGKATPRVVAAGELAEAKQALAEMRRLIPTDGHGPVPHDEAKRLLDSKTYTLWALGACLLAYEGDAAAIRSMARAAGTEQATLAQVDWVGYLLTEVVPDSAKAVAKEEWKPMVLNYLWTHNAELQSLPP